jgi:hypothetical protein
VADQKPTPPALGGGQEERPVEHPMPPGVVVDACNCDDCPSDPNSVCTPTGEEVSVLRVYLPTAYKGNLILCPGGSMGIVGGLLHQVNPPQHYSHMGIMVRDQDLIRHSPASSERLTSDEYFTGHVLGVLPAPTDGLIPDHLQYAWPGPVTQSVEQALYADQYASANLTPPGSNGSYPGADLLDPESPTQKTYTIAALSFDRVWDDGKWYPPLIVQPHSRLETPQVTACLNAIADQVMTTYGHYRFACYTKAAIGGDPNRQGPQAVRPDAQPVWDSVAQKWTDWTDKDNPGGKPPVRVPFTSPSVCSSFVWQAVQDVNKARGKAQPEIVLDWAADREEALGTKQLADIVGAAVNGAQYQRAVPPDWDADLTDALTEDGLYFYDEAQRQDAGKWLEGKLEDQVFSQLKSALRDMGGIGKAVADAINYLGRDGFIAATQAGVADLVTVLNAVPPLAPFAAELDPVFVEQLIELLHDMPTDIANQVCNSFAFDCHRGFPGDIYCVDAAGNHIWDVDSDNWHSAPGVGRAVSPDNLHMFWDAPGPSVAGKIQRGLYGHNLPAQPVKAVVRRPLCELVPRTGTARLWGIVRYQGQPVAGAHVHAGCQKAITNPKGEYELSVGSGGQYTVVARTSDYKPNVGLYGQKTTGRPNDPPIAPNADVQADITLLDPPECLRYVTATFTLLLDDVATFGTDHLDPPQHRFEKVLHVQYGVAHFDENGPQWRMDPNDQAAIPYQYDVAQAGDSVGDSSGTLKVEVVALPNFSVNVTLTGKGSNNVTAGPVEFNVTPGATVAPQDMWTDTGGAFPDRAYFRGISITNSGIPAY